MSVVNDYPVDLWVLSAGLGLLKHDDAVIPYQATFAAGHSDSIPLYSESNKGKSFHQTWWQALGECSPFQESHPTLLSDLMRSKPNEYFIICGSPDYINAIATDLINGISYLNTPKKQLIIISSQHINPELKQYHLVSNKRIADWLTCNMLMLNIKMAQYVIQQFNETEQDDLGYLADKLQKQFALLPATLKSSAIRRPPEEVEQWIAHHLKTSPESSASRALRAFRDSGNSFEEKRFRNLFHAVQQNKR